MRPAYSNLTALELEAGSDTVLSVGGRCYFKDTLALSFGTTFAADVDTLRVGFRAEL